MPRPSAPLVSIRCKITFTESGAPLTPEDTIAYRKRARAGLPSAGRPGWFWTEATPGAAASLCEESQRVVGTVYTTWFPPQSPGESVETLASKPEPSGIYIVSKHPDGTKSVRTTPLRPA